MLKHINFRKPLAPKAVNSTTSQLPLQSWSHLQKLHFARNNLRCQSTGYFRIIHLLSYRRNSGTWTPNTADYQCLTTPLDHIDACRDTCSTLYDDIMTIGQKQICPAGNSIIYVIRLAESTVTIFSSNIQGELSLIFRGVTDDGKCITLDNDSGRRMDYDQATRRWIYVDEEDGQKEYMLKAASCALGGISFLTKHI